MAQPKRSDNEICIAAQVRSAQLEPVPALCGRRIRQDEQAFANDTDARNALTDPTVRTVPCQKCWLHNAGATS